MEPDLIQDSVKKESLDEYEFGPNFKCLKGTDNVRELQTVLRDKYVHFTLPLLCPSLNETKCLQNSNTCILI